MVKEGFTLTDDYQVQSTDGGTEIWDQILLLILFTVHVWVRAWLGLNCQLYISTAGDHRHGISPQT